MQRKNELFSLSGIFAAALVILIMLVIILSGYAGYYKGKNSGLLSDYSSKIEKLEKDKQVISQQYVNAIDVINFAVQKDTTGTILAIAKKKGL